MLKLTILWFVTLMVLCAKAQWEDPNAWTGQVGIYCQVNSCEGEGKTCSRSKPCCCPNVCWVHGECGAKVEESVSSEGLTVITGQVGEFQQYDNCDNSKGRIGDSCNKFEDCCIPLNCEDKVCTSREGLIANIGKLMSGGG